MEKRNHHPETVCIQGGWNPGNGEPRVLPIYQSTTFKYSSSEQMGRLFDLEEDGYFYTRLANPTNDAVAEKICELEGGAAAMLTSSGQAANYFAVFNICSAGDHIVSAATIYGGTSNLFTVTMKKQGIDVTLVDPFQYILLSKGTIKQDWSMHVEFLTDQMCFRVVFRCNGTPKVNSPLKITDGYYTMDLDALETKIVENKVKLFLLCSPHNPVGRVWSEEELRRVGEICLRHGVLVVSDEIHSDFTREGHPHTVFAKLGAEFEQNCLICTAPSKTFNLAGLQQAAAFCRDRALLERLEKTLRDAGVVSGNIFGMVATEAAFAHGDAWLDAMLDYVAEGYAILREEVEKRLPGAVLTPLEATYLGWLDLRAWGLTTAQLMERTRAAGVEFTAGTFFGEAAGEGFLRVNLACPHERVRLAAGQIEQALK